jgi:uncharacterized protein YbbC (DUF1343 family)
VNQTGLEVFLESKIDIVAGARVGLIAHPASIDSRFAHAADLLARHPAINLTTLFGPQHGYRGETQDNMIEWESFRDRRTGLIAYSLYGQTRKPAAEMLSEVDVLLFDLQDVGARVYTFVSTMALAMQACREAGKRFVVLDRPNPITGMYCEGNLLEPGFASFVGMYPIPMRHAMTVGELASMFNAEFAIGCDLEIVRMKGWNRGLWFDQTGFPWVPPSPNIPTLETAMVYPGSVMTEGTNISEGRGTTRPFEIIGAPFIDPDQLAAELRREQLPGVVFRPMYFQPAFNKFAGRLCGGIQLHVTDRSVIRPVITGVAVIAAIRRLYSEFEWKEPPYEYVSDRLPFDVITGTSRLRESIEAGWTIQQIEESWREEVESFERQRASYLLYE